MTQVNFRIEDDIKANAESALKEMGLNMSTAITMFLVKVGRERRIPFEICEGKKEVTREGALAAFDAIRAKAIKDGIADMSLEEINAEIAKVRHGEK